MRRDLSFVIYRSIVLGTNSLRATNSVMSRRQIYSPRCRDQRRGFPTDVSQGCTEHRTATNHFVVAIGRNPCSSHRDDPSANFTLEKTQFLNGSGAARADTRPKLSSPSSSEKPAGWSFDSPLEAHRSSEGTKAGAPRRFQ